MGSKRNKYVPRTKRINIDQECKAWKKEALTAKMVR
jgi:hypothetical protein